MKRAVCLDRTKNIWLTTLHAQAVRENIFCLFACMFLNCTPFYVHCVCMPNFAFSLLTFTLLFFGEFSGVANGVGSL